MSSFLPFAFSFTCACLLQTIILTLFFLFSFRWHKCNILRRESRHSHSYFLWYVHVSPVLFVFILDFGTYVPHFLEASFDFFLKKKTFCIFVRWSKSPHYHFEMSQKLQIWHLKCEIHWNLLNCYSFSFFACFSSHLLKFM